MNNKTKPKSLLLVLLISGLIANAGLALIAFNKPAKTQDLAYNHYKIN